MNEDLVRKYRDLWIEIFKDNAAFVEKYFKTFLNSSTFYHLNSDKAAINAPKELATALIACDYKWFWNEKTLSFAYLSGILTANKFRRQGFCSMLIKNTLNSLFDKDYSLCGLIAADDNLVNYYKKFSFVQLAQVNEQIFGRIDADTKLFDKYIFIKDADITDTRYKRFFNTKDNAIKHDNNTLQLYNNNEYLRLSVMYQGSIRAIAIGRKTKYFIELLDLEFTDKESKLAILSFIAKSFRRDVKIMGTKNNMIRILNARQILQIYAYFHPYDNFSLHVEDKFIEKNNITVALKDGKLQDIDNSYKVRKISIEELTLNLFSQATMYLMLDR
ncbi:MAG: GNAT family N-acetyltransferase [Bacteroidales bacterium]|nr:GNAT family N-acetyltransferase [Bacteroidales bacterium]